jgi:D-alanyl-D-alanine carboxypeptidase/D-alanyl-D-alanine-endopeptidase (penicillin-binding protein 4)
VTLSPDASQSRVNLITEPPLTDAELTNQIHLGNGRCGDWKDGLRATVAGSPPRLLLSGAYSTACGEQDWNVGVLPPALYMAAVFRDLWQDLGGRLGGTVHDGSLPAQARLLASHDSPALAEVVRDINKFSNNVMARQLYLTLGLAAGHRPARPADAEAELRAWLDRRKLDFPELVLENGAGLSRRERISADSLGELLQLAWSGPLMPEFVSSLPLAAVDGTMKKRLGETELAGQAHIKTGTLAEVKTMAGYLRDKTGHIRILVLLINDPNAEGAQDAQDALLQWAYSALQKPARVGKP